MPISELQLPRSDTAVFSTAPFTACRDKQHDLCKYVLLQIDPDGKQPANELLCPCFCHMDHTWPTDEIERYLNS